MDHKDEKLSPAEEVDYKDIVGDNGGLDDVAFEKRITRKLDLHILPWLFVIWLLAFIDRSNIGQWAFSFIQSSPFG